MPYDNEMKGVLFKNDKGDNPSRPDFRGNVTIHGVEYQLAAWKHESQNPEVGKYLSMKVTAPDGSGQPVRQAAAQDPDDDIGF